MRALFLPLVLVGCLSSVSPDARLFLACSGWIHALDNLTLPKRMGKVSTENIAVVDALRFEVTPICTTRTVSTSNILRVESAVVRLLAIGKDSL